jgi:hypothetical protein
LPLSLAILAILSGGRHSSFTCLWLLQAAYGIVSECANAVRITSPNYIHRVMQPIFRWSGQYFGFIADGYLFDSTSEYRGWVGSDGTIWRADGKFLGDLVGGEYVLFQKSADRAGRAPRVRPARPTTPARPDDRIGRGQRSGYVDGLDELP